MLDQITGAMGGAGPKYRGFQPGKGNIGRYEKYQMEDVNRLHGFETTGKGKRGKAITGDPFTGPGLGYNQATLEMQAGLSEGGRTASRQQLFDAYKQSPYGTRGREFMTAQEGLERGMAEDQGRTAAGIAVANEGQKRSDLYTRLGMTGEAYGQGAQLYNQNAQAEYQANMARFQEKKNRYAAVGKAGDMLLMGGI